MNLDIVILEYDYDVLPTWLLISRGDVLLRISVILTDEYDIDPSWPDIDFIILSDQSSFIYLMLQYTFLILVCLLVQLTKDIIY